MASAPPRTHADGRTEHTPAGLGDGEWYWDPEHGGPTMLGPHGNPAFRVTLLGLHREDQVEGGPWVAIRHGAHYRVQTQSLVVDTKSQYDIEIDDELQGTWILAPHGRPLSTHAIERPDAVARLFTFFASDSAEAERHGATLRADGVTPKAPGRHGCIEVTAFADTPVRPRARPHAQPCTLGPTRGATRSGPVGLSAGARVPESRLQSLSAGAPRAGCTGLTGESSQTFASAAGVAVRDKSTWWRARFRAVCAVRPDAADAADEFVVV